MILNTVYKRDVSGSIRIWYAEIGEGPLEGHWRTVSGLLDGEKVASEWKFAPPKSQFNAEEQAIFEATSAMTKKLKIDYRKSIDNIDEKRHSFIKPMLAQPYPGWIGQCYVQPKIDGMRCIANAEGLWSRLNRRIVSVPHIEAALENVFEEYPEIIIDGELYNHDLHDDFNTIMSLTKKTKPTMADLEKSEELIEYWVFDMFDPDKPKMIFEERLKTLTMILTTKAEPHAGIILTPTIKVFNEEDLNLDFQTLLENGYEGQMIRYNTAYDQKRSPHLLKRKEYVDEEFELIDIVEGQGNWAGYAKIAECVTPDGRAFGAGISGTQEFNLQLLKDRKKYKSVTVKYFQLTPDGVPRFPIAIKFHEELFDDLKERIKPRKDLFG
jgi:DNA ligase-1